MIKGDDLNEDIKKKLDEMFYRTAKKQKRKKIRMNKIKKIKSK